MFDHIQWVGNARTGCLRLLDQTRLPQEQVFIDCKDVQSVWDAIKRLVVRGAPAIGVAAAYGCVIGAQEGSFRKAADHLATSRPTAVNLFWAIKRMSKVSPKTPADLLKEARAIHREDIAMCENIGLHGQELMRRHIEECPPADGLPAVLTHCNAGALATSGIGLITAPLYQAHQRGVRFSVYADETRPLLQGSRLTAWELKQAGVDVTVICDSMAAQVMREGRVKMVITGADRIAANGDTANKIGTYGLAVLAQYHRIPFYIAAPSSTFDFDLHDGTGIPIEQRAAQEITHGFGCPTAPEGVQTYSPAFDVTPAHLIRGIVTDKGLIEPVNPQNIARVIRGNEY